MVNIEKKLPQTEDTVSVRDLSIASYLLASGAVSLMGTHKTSNGDVFFQFSPKSQVERLISLYWADNAPAIQPRKLFGAQRDLKDLIFLNADRDD